LFQAGHVKLKSAVKEKVEGSDIDVKINLSFEVQSKMKVIFLYRGSSGDLLLPITAGQIIILLLVWPIMRDLDLHFSHFL
jgi:hypothetical protein